MLNHCRVENKFLKKLLPQKYKFLCLYISNNLKTVFINTNNNSFLILFEIPVQGRMLMKVKY